MGKTIKVPESINGVDAEIICSHKLRCTRYPSGCNSCKHNAGKKDYYEPTNPPIITPDWAPPPLRRYPWPPHRPRPLPFTAPRSWPKHWTGRDYEIICMM